MPWHLPDESPNRRGRPVTRHARAYGWIEVPDVPFDGPKLPLRRRNGTPWPDWVASQWDSWRTMPHARLWQQADWSFALDTIELASRAYDDGAKVGLLTEVRYREKMLGTTWSARQDMRIRYTQPASAAPDSVTRLDDYRNL